MNVWLVNPFDSLPPEGHRPQRYWLMAEAFVAAGHRVTLWTSDFSHATKRKRRVAAQVEVEGGGVEVVLIPTLPYPKNVCFARIRSHLRLARDFERLALGAPKPDLVIASTPPLGLCAAAMRVARRTGARFVCDIQDAWPETFERLLPCGFKWMGRVLFTSMHRTARTLYREADLVTGVCERYAELSGRRDYYRAYLGISCRPSFKSESKSGRTNPLTRLVYAGNLGVGYDLETVIAAVEKRPDLTLDIAGAPNPACRTETRNPRVRHHGYLDASDLRALFARCDVGVIPMRDDSWVGLPNKLVDYLAAGLPVISSLHGECGELLARTNFGRTYDFGSVDSLLAALDDLPSLAVSLPDELRADAIYPAYVARVSRVR